MEAQIQKQGRIFVRLQKMKKTQSLLHPMALFLLALTFAICTMWSLAAQANHALECYNPLVGDCDKVQINPPPLFMI